ncbi:DUF4396 domain-containing protein [Streptomyces bungoensis]|uniref:DUF4396 domain-containing protein n=1 Tax=Streptomyces bungoensis TaxID=285568 RepID=UPI000A6049DA
MIEEQGEPDPEKLPGWVTSAKTISHCGAGCVLGDIAGEWLVRASGLTIAGKPLYADFLLDFAFAWLLGIGFQYFTIVPMRDVGPAQGLFAAVKADTFSIPAFQVGLFAGMWAYQELHARAGQDHGRILAPDAGRHDRWILHGLAGQRLAGPGRLEGTDVTGTGIFMQWTGSSC